MTGTNDEARKSPARTITLAKVRKSIGEWEAAGTGTPTSTKASQPGPSKLGTKKRLSLEPDQSANIEHVTGTPSKAAPKDKTAEARACLNKAKLHLNNSRNLKAEIKAGVVEAIDHLYQIVKELDKALKEREEKKPVEHRPTKEPKVELDQSSILEQLSVTTKSLQENNLKIEELQKKIERHYIEQAPQTYAAVASKAVPNPQLQSEKTTLHSVIITSEDIEDTGDTVLSKIRDTIDAKEGWLKVERIRKARDRKIIISVGSRKERDQINEKLKSSGQRLTCEEVNNKDPLLILLNVLSVHEDSEVLKALRNQNRHLFENLDPAEDRVEIKYRKRARNPLTNHIIIQTSPIIWRRATESGSLHTDLQKIRVEDQSPLVQCTRCLGYGHSKRFCKEAIDSCSHCGGPHLRSECAEWLAGVVPSCKNCKSAKQENTEHNAFSGDCPIRKRWDGLARSAVAYC